MHIKNNKGQKLQQSAFWAGFLWLWQHTMSVCAYFLALYNCIYQCPFLKCGWMDGYVYERRCPACWKAAASWCHCTPNLHQHLFPLIIWVTHSASFPAEIITIIYMKSLGFYNLGCTVNRLSLVKFIISFHDLDLKIHSQDDRISCVLNIVDVLQVCTANRWTFRKCLLRHIWMKVHIFMNGTR